MTLVTDLQIIGLVWLRNVIRLVGWRASAPARGTIALLDDSAGIILPFGGVGKCVDMGGRGGSG